MSSIILGVLFLAVGGTVVFTVLKNRFASLPKPRARVDPSVFSVMELEAPEYREKSRVGPKVEPKPERSLGIGAGPNAGRERDIAPTGISGEDSTDPRTPPSGVRPQGGPGGPEDRPKKRDDPDSAFLGL